ncbi:PAS domain S-box-containing protein [Methylobacterium phyllostachyos]|uniref:Blue-light-activated histidine kinase n=1 Tax=Methylobacterium phyllostachyos TaxID=582672 RepID=A0A1H0H9E5_9HYPH|nr:PAS domain S-box protein [Methylobacterium phyllostachyos]SDO15799.1 PAS domain S-box-containing protein [Methylobacterium phyllostachyos]
MDVPAPHALAASEPTGGPWSTAARIAELRDLAILDTESEPLYDDLVRVAAYVCRAPVALVSLVDAERQWFKSEVGLGKRELPISCSVCAHTIEAGALLVIPDLTADPRTIENPLVSGPEGFRFYAGAVIRGGQGIPLGALCVLDRTPRPEGLDSEQEATLLALARQISSLLEHRRTLAQVASREAELAASERRFRVMTAAMPQMVWTTRPDGFHDYYNDRWYEFTGVPYGSTDGEGWNDMFHPDDQERAWARWRHSLATGEPYEIEYRLRHNSGAYRWTLGRAMPIRDAAGRIERWFGTCTDIDDLKQAETEARKLAAIVETSKDFIGLCTLDGAITHLNEAALTLVGLPDLAAARRHRIPDFFTDDSRRILEETAMPAMRRDGFWEGELAFRHFVTGEPVAVLYNIFPVRDPTGAEIGYATVTRDLREVKRAEEARDLLIRELSHRIKNIFAVVGGLAALTARSDPAAQPFAKAFRERLGALARAHEYVRPHSPDSAPAVAGQTVLGLMRLIMAAYEEGGQARVAISGDDAEIGERTATALALIMHEQATNAMKYGGLSTKEGGVSLSGLREAGRYTLTWQEAGGPPVTGTPSRKGFGTVLAERSVAGQLDGVLEHDWAPGGLLMRLSVPIENLRA